ASVHQLVARPRIGLVQLLQARANLIQVSNKQGELVIQPTGALGDLPGILPLTLLTPQAVDHPQSSQQRSRTDDDDSLLESLLEKPPILLQCGGKGSLKRHEEQYEVQAVQALQTAVILAGKILQVPAQ